MAQTRRLKKTAAFGDLTEEAIRCRVNGHIWRPYNARRVVGAFETEEQCERCRSDRISVIGNRGEVRSRHIKYAENYLSKDGHLEASDRDSMRLTVIRWDYRL